MAASTSPKDLCTTTFKQQWVINDLLTVLKNEDMTSQTTEILCKENNLEYVRFLVGFKKFPIDKSFRLYWKSLQQHNCLLNEEMILAAEFLKNTGTALITVQTTAKPELGTIIETDRNTFSYDYEWTPENTQIWRNSEGSLVINLEVTFKFIPS